MQADKEMSVISYRYVWVILLARLPFLNEQVLKAVSLINRERSVISARLRPNISHIGMQNGPYYRTKWLR